MSTTVDSHNPYLVARYVDNERYCSLTKSIRNWQLVGGALLLANIGLATGLVYVTSKQQVAPYIVEVDAAGSAVAMRELRAEAEHDPVRFHSPQTLPHRISEILTHQPLTN